MVRRVSWEFFLSALVGGGITAIFSVVAIIVREKMVEKRIQKERASEKKEKEKEKGERKAEKEKEKRELRWSKLEKLLLELDQNVFVLREFITNFPVFPLDFKVNMIEDILKDEKLLLEIPLSLTRVFNYYLLRMLHYKYVYEFHRTDLSSFQQDQIIEYWKSHMNALQKELVKLKLTVYYLVRIWYPFKEIFPFLDLRLLKWLIKAEWLKEDFPESSLDMELIEQGLEVFAITPRSITKTTDESEIFRYFLSIIQFMIDEARLYGLNDIADSFEIFQKEYRSFSDKASVKPED